MRTFITLLFSALLIIPSFGQVVPIAQLRINNSSGVPVDTGQVFTVTGIVTSGNHFGNAGPGSIQDGTAGVSVYGSNFANQVVLGDSVTVTSVLTHFNGLTQLDFRRTGSSFVKHNTGYQTEPLVLTLTQIINQQWNGFEEYESMLIRVNNVTISGTGNFASGTNYNISDPTGSISAGLRIDNDVTSIIGTPIPSGPVDIICILGQYKTSAPYSTGYQLLPRFVQDIVYDGAPVILNPVFAAGIDSSSFTVYFNTARNGNSKVKYGLTPSLELDSVVINDDTTYHIVPVSGLQSSTLYYFKAYSTNAAGTSEGPLQTVTTASSNPTLGDINVYFNFSVDTTVAMPGNNANGNADFKGKLIDRINTAEYSIDLALYSFFGMQEVADAIIIAKNRGVKVRIVYDNRETQNSMQALLNAGILMSKRPTTNGIMHNKFFVFDARDNEESNDWVWTGSWNVTSLELTWENNVIEINDPALADAYTIEFNEMWGSEGEIPNPANAKFGNQKIDNTQHNFTIGTRPLQLYFSPSDGTTGKIINTLNTSNNSIYFALNSFTRSDIANTIQNRKNLGINDIRGIIEQISGSQYSFLQTFCEVYQDVGNTMHHKYALIDASFPGSDPLTLTGSHNWSSNAEEDNDENTIIVNDLKIANQYLQEFKKRYNEAGGTGSFVIPTGVDDQKFDNFSYNLYQNYPNPFNPVTTIRFEVPFTQHVELKVYDVLGREVATLFNDTAPAGIVAVDLNADNLSSGVYIYTVKADNVLISKKMVLMK